MNTNETEEKTYRVLSIDAWREPEGGWTWNQWYNAGTIPDTCLNWSNRKLFKWFRDEGKLSSFSTGKIALEDDQYNLVIVNKNTREPLFAIEYGAGQ